jgi:integrase
MSGSVKRDDMRGSWYFVVDVTGPNGRRQLKRRGFATRKAAATALAAVVADSARGTFVIPTRSTLATFITVSRLPMISQRVRPTTFDGYRRAVTNHVLPDLGAIALGQLSRATVATWVSELSGRGLAPKTVRNLVAVLTKILDDAQEVGLLTSNVAQRLRNLPAASPQRPRAWTIAQAQRFIAHVRDDRWYPLWRFYIVTGVRRGEALGLRWDDVDLDAGTVTIRHQRTIAGGSAVEGPPKTKSGARTIAVDATMVAALRAWRRNQAEERLAMGAGWHGDGWVFCWPTGEPLWPQTVTAWFRQHCRALGLPEIGVHGLRHTTAT